MAAKLKTKGNWHALRKKGGPKYSPYKKHFQVCLSPIEKFFKKYEKTYLSCSR